MIELDFITDETIYVTLGTRRVSTDNTMEALNILKEHIQHPEIDKWIKIKGEGNANIQNNS